MTPLDRAAMTLALCLLRRGPRELVRSEVLDTLLTSDAVWRVARAVERAHLLDTGDRLLRARLALYLRAALREGEPRGPVCLPCDVVICTCCEACPWCGSRERRQARPLWELAPRSAE